MVFYSVTAGVMETIVSVVMNGEWCGQVCLNLTASPWQHESSPIHTLSSVRLGDVHFTCTVQLDDIHFMYTV